MAKELTSYDKIEMVLFKGREDAAQFLSDREMQQKERWMLCVSKLLEDPVTQDKDLVTFLTGGWWFLLSCFAGYCLSGYCSY